MSAGWSKYASQLAGNVVGAGSTVLALLFDGLTIALFTFYLCADGPRFRRTICSVLPPRTQREVLRAWEIAIEKTGGYIYSRALLALICTVAHYILLALLDIPFAFALALWMGVLSQFIPTVGTYIGGALPVLVALLDGFWPALWVLVFVTVYQQFENYLLQPRITAKTLDMHPAVAFGSVLAGVAILGAPGALLALPAGASCRLSSFIRRYEVASTRCWARATPGAGGVRVLFGSSADPPTPLRPLFLRRTQQTGATRKRRGATYSPGTPAGKPHKPLRGTRGNFWTPVETVCRNHLVESVPPRGRLIAYSLVGGVVEMRQELTALCCDCGAIRRVTTYRGIGEAQSAHGAARCVVRRMCRSCGRQTYHAYMRDDEDRDELEDALRLDNALAAEALEEEISQLRRCGVEVGHAPTRDLGQSAGRRSPSD